MLYYNTRRALVASKCPSESPTPKVESSQPKVTTSYSEAPILPVTGWAIFYACFSFRESSALLQQDCQMTPSVLPPLLQVPCFILALQSRNHISFCIFCLFFLLSQSTNKMAGFLLVFKKGCLKLRPRRRALLSIQPELAGCLLQ